MSWDWSKIDIPILENQWQVVGDFDGISQEVESSDHPVLPKFMIEAKHQGIISLGCLVAEQGHQHRIIVSHCFYCLSQT